MSKSLHFAKKYEIEFSSGALCSWDQDALFEILNDYEVEIGHNEDTFCPNDFDIDRDALEEFVEKLKKDEREVIKGRNKSKIVDLLSRALSETPQHYTSIHFSWF